MIPISQIKTYNLVRNTITVKQIIELSDEIVHNDMTTSMLINNIAKALLKEDEVNTINDMTQDFRLNLLEYIEETLVGRYTYESKTYSYYDSQGKIITETASHIVMDKEKKERNNPLFKNPEEPENYIILKGSEKKLDNNSTGILNLFSTVTNMVRECNPNYVKLCAAMEYEENKMSQSEPPMKYKRSQIALAEETILYMGYEFLDNQKLDASGRNYPLTRFGLAYQYGASFNKYMIQPKLTYTVTNKSVLKTIKYLRDEYGIDGDLHKEYNRIDTILDYNLGQLKKWTKHQTVNFSIDYKELGKLLKIQALMDNIIWNVGYESRELISKDLKNSGCIMFAAGFGDAQHRKVANLTQSDIQYDTHQEVADEIGVSRKLAKEQSQGPNHGAKITPDKEYLYNIFGESYKGLNGLAEYGKKLLHSGVTLVTMYAPDGVKVYFYGYVLDAKLKVGNTFINLVAPFSKYTNIGLIKGYGMGVKPNHGSDSFIVRYVKRELILRNIPHLTLLDNYDTPPDFDELVESLVYDALDILQGHWYNEIKRIEKETGIKMDYKLVPNTEKIARTGFIF